METLAELVPVAAGRDPFGPALLDGEAVLTWSDVERDTAGMASALVAGGVKSGDRVAIARNKGIESHLAVHAILRAGGIVVPLDPLAPGAAIDAVVADADPIAIVGDRSVIDKIDLATAAPRLHTVIATTPDTPRFIDVIAANGAASAELPTLTADDPAYLIYSSGSTGRPKGILHSHGSGLAYAELAMAEYGITAADRLAAMTPLHFDMSTLELYAMPLAGASSVMFSEAELRFPATFTQRAAAARCTLWYAVPYMLQQIADRGALADRDLSTLRSILYGGEVYPAEPMRRLMNLVPGVPLVNVYGPAEVNACTNLVIAEPPSEITDLPLGRPWGDVRIRVVDRTTHSDTEPGQPGELLVSARTRMIGYWRRPDLDAACTVPRPDGPDWYRTGDIAIADTDGVLWFLGRRDHQVKIRGVRLELEGIESVVAAAPGVLHAVVGPAADGASLVAAVVMGDGIDFDQRALRRYVAARVAPAALPSTFHHRSEMPTTASGKIDRREVRAELARADASGAALASEDAIGPLPEIETVR